MLTRVQPAREDIGQQRLHNRLAARSAVKAVGGGNPIHGGRE